MTVLTIVKIDICKSKRYAANQEKVNPSVRKDALEKLLAVSCACLPGEDKAYPEGSHYKAEGDAVYYVVEKPTVGLRAAIEFMQSWYHQGLSEYPDCRVLLDRGPIDEIEAAGKVELTSRAFENLAVMEKLVGDGKVYLTRAVLDSCDQTMVKFSFFRDFAPIDGEILKVYWADFLDPRTVADSGLVHALFVAHPSVMRHKFLNTHGNTLTWQLFL